ncbi:Hpt domain-containing protein [Roseibacillus persicicus]|uniref:HPt domain-containing protein n=1 Tax=Roseibacillus persicicus TaxID=454148 RepID=A0A918TRS3_9BACT|nr:Hpt domain-containing protein [Roseibacillus persicicus]MDQ8189572.1 Hpt domain-containing protein [Roseibacillus persicicus]GHC59657.1 hypothetical protein GCM10007100_28600 [Roseibacillus persicicus]
MEEKLTVDFQQIEMLGGLACAEVKEILDDYLDSLDETLEGMSPHFASGDSGAVREEAHRLKGAAKMCGFVALGEQFEALENEAEAGRLPEFSPWSVTTKELAQATRRKMAEASSK